MSDRYETCYLVSGENVILSFFCLCYIIGVDDCYGRFSVLRSTKKKEKKIK